LNFLEATFLIVLSVLLALICYFSVTRPERGLARRKREETRETLPLQGQENDIDKAFEWFILLLTVLVAIIFQFLTWITSPVSSLELIAKFMFSLIAPLMLSIIGWLWQLITLRNQLKIALRLFSWSVLSIVFVYYMELFFAMVALGLFNKYKESAAIATIVVLVVALVVGGLFPHTRILTTYKTLTTGNEFWRRRPLQIWAPYLVGMGATALFILLPFLV